MQIIPVIDLSQGCVVHAQRGERQHYRPIESSLCKGSEPLAIIAALLELYPFDTLYIADLDAIQKRGNHLEIIKRIRKTYPQLQIWLDAGIANVHDLEAWQLLDMYPDIQWVLGSESLHSMGDYLDLKNQSGADPILSLDFTGSGYQGPAELLEDSTQWPSRVIAMTLGHVGNNLGPDYSLITNLVSHNTKVGIYAAGGVRNMEDLLQLERAGVASVLVASALHSGQIKEPEIARIFAI